MTDIKFQIIQSENNDKIQLIADWYFNEWKIPRERTIQKLKSFGDNKSQFQVLMILDNMPISTGGLYNHVGLHDKEPRFRILMNWLALVYTIPSMRHKGFGELICNFIQDHSKSLGVKEMYLYTDTAERLYKRLGWVEIERLTIEQRNILVMKKELK